MIVLEDLSKTYGTFQAVHHLRLRVARGEVYGFLGPNGAGKTTTIRMLMGILVPTTGYAHIDGLDCHSQRVEVKRKVGYLPDNPIFYDYLRGREIIEFVAQMHDLSRRDAALRAAALLEQLDLVEVSEEFAVNYSMGMKKKLALACSMVHRPAVLVLDEPTNGLDPRAAREVKDLLREHAATGHTIFLSTHLLAMAEELCDRVGIISAGTLVAEGTVESLKSQVAPGGTLEEVFLRATEEVTE